MGLAFAPFSLLSLTSSLHLCSNVLKTSSQMDESSKSNNIGSRSLHGGDPGEGAGSDGTGSASATGPSQPLGQTKKRVKVYPEKVNRVRAKKPKSRTGCRTCK